MNVRDHAVRGSLYAILFFAALVFFISTDPTHVQERAPATSSTSQPAAIGSIVSSSTDASIPQPQPSTTTIALVAPAIPTAVAKTRQVAQQSPAPGTTPSSANAPYTDQASNEVHRLDNPYTFSALPVDQLNTGTRAALVNILCTPKQGGTFSPISGSGVVIDPRGVILTNAHVAQYVLLSQDPRINMQCTIRTGAPARPAYTAQMLYIPPEWVREHAKEFGTARPQGTGEHDYALLYVTGSATNTPLPGSFPFLAPDTRANVAFQGDQVLVASYPAEFLGGTGTEYGLYAASSVSKIGNMLTFSTDTADVLSLGGVIEAQSGSSGGAVVNAWGRLVGLIVTTSAGSTTSERDLHSLSISYINRDLASQRGTSLDTILAGDPAQDAVNFSANVVPSLVEQYWDLMQN